MPSEPITASQIKIIHTLKNRLAMDEEDYRVMIKGGCGMESSKHLTTSQAAQLIDNLENMAVAAGVWDRRGWKGATRISNGQAAVKARVIGSIDNFGERGGMATPPQLRKIEAMWSEVSRATPEYRTMALRQFVNRIAHVSDLRFLDSVGAGTVINALKKMRERKSQSARHRGVGQSPRAANQNHV